MSATISAKLGESADSTCATFLSNVEAEQGISAALVAKSSKLSTLEAAWNTALSN